MTVSTRFVLAIVATFAIAGCDKSAAEAQEKANKAQGEATLTAANAQAEANKKATTAQANADKDIAEAKGDFAKTREDYRHTVQSKLDAVDKKIALLEADAKKATGKAKADLDAKVTNLRAQRTAFGAEVKSLETSTAATWDSSKARVDKAMTDLEAAADARL